MDLDTIASRAAIGDPRERPSRLAKAGLLERLRPGVYLDAEAWAKLGEAERHLARMAAARHVLGDRTVFSHESAAVALGIPVLGGLPTRPCVLVEPGGSKSSGLVRRVHRDRGDGVLRRASGFLIPAVSQVVVDLAASRTPLAAVVAVSHARRRLGLPLGVLQAQLGLDRPRRGARSVERALVESTDLSDSVLETLTLVRIRDLGFAEPEQQREVSAGGRRYRVDFAWEDGEIVLEVDGRVKYEDPDLLGERSGAAALWGEKRRADAILSSVRRLVRATWSEVWEGHELERRLLAAGVPRARRPRPLTR